ncbi:hypothetical protein AAMO2058_001657700 [Amorphochlora amoebiformis]
MQRVGIHFALFHLCMSSEMNLLGKTSESCSLTESELKSWVEYPSDCPFPIQNLPFGVFSTKTQGPRVGSAIGKYAIDLCVLEDMGIMPAETKGVFLKTSLNAYMALGKAVWAKTRRSLIEFFDKKNEAMAPKDSSKILIPLHTITMHLPANIGDYTDFYSSRPHATNVGIMFRGKENALRENWLHLPVGYHGRASSVVVSGTPIRRPNGQVRADAKKAPEFLPSQRLDFELEIAFFVGGPGNALGSKLSLEEAQDSIFGLVLMNDWSARDVQKWEYVPLGPFCGKNFATTISPWVVTMEALAPFKITPPKQDPPALKYLDIRGKPIGVYDINLAVHIKGLESKESGPGSVVSRSNAKYLYWTFEQQLTHHSSTGCNMRPGDLLGSGTISGPKDTQYGSMLELSWNGSRQLNLPDGPRTFLKDGDTVTMTGYAQGEGFRIGFGQCTGSIEPANKL